MYYHVLSIVRIEFASVFGDIKIKGRALEIGKLFSMPKKRSALGTNGWRSNSKTCRRSSCLHDWLLCSSLNWEELNFTTHHILQFFILHIAKISVKSKGGSNRGSKYCNKKERLLSSKGLPWKKAPILLNFMFFHVFTQEAAALDALGASVRKWGSSTSSKQTTASSARSGSWTKPTCGSSWARFASALQRPPEPRLLKKRKAGNSEQRTGSFFCRTFE